MRPYLPALSENLLTAVLELYLDLLLSLLSSLVLPLLEAGDEIPSSESPKAYLRAYGLNLISNFVLPISLL